MDIISRDNNYAKRNTYHVCQYAQGWWYHQKWSIALIKLDLWWIYTLDERPVFHPEAVEGTEEQCNDKEDFQSLRPTHSCKRAVTHNPKGDMQKAC